MKGLTTKLVASAATSWMLLALTTAVNAVSIDHRGGQLALLDEQSKGNLAATTEESSSRPYPALHQLCIPSSEAARWSGALRSSIDNLGRGSAFEADIWSSQETSAQKWCIDFTFSSDPDAHQLVREAVDVLGRNVPVEWTITADSQALQQRVEEQRSASDLTGLSGDDHFHNGYHSLGNITAFMSWQVAQYPSLAQLVDLGTTYEEKIIQGIRIGRQPKRHDNENGRKRQIVITAGAHGREWITTSTAVYLITHLLARSRRFLDHFSILIVPVLNPDGYAHTWESDRFFRKNRQLVSDDNGGGWWPPRRKCYGIDISRNFPVNFRADDAQSGSGACSPTYAGEDPLATAESRALATYLRDEANGVVSFIDLHSYGQLLLYPWMSCNPDSSLHNNLGESIPDEEDISEVAFGAARAAKLVHNRQYRAGRGCETMYGQDGSSVDFSYADARIKWSFEMELRDEGSYGFLLPPEQIRPTGEEAAASLDYILNFIAKREHL